MLSSLCLIPACNITIHEAHEEFSLEKIKSAILSEGYLRHPILVTKMNDGRYLVIDGAHRFQALCSIVLKSLHKL
ncbi:ParB N-terminal domain-containing protein [Legionella drozanskii]|uniref:ParB-like nuclease domain protein n=1 Tax=Legionella drozanskii LLAP-1 TaxID=1212489 RepID=A0A0W0SXT5_9GAMM|nr:ParB-like nuclease domain protein [Legionella drozanskii LLAP-1]